MPEFAELAVIKTQLSPQELKKSHGFWTSFPNSSITSTQTPSTPN
jgi:hypothetical protein